MPFYPLSPSVTNGGLSPGSVLCVVRYPANTGYAWDFIESLYARMANHLALHGVRTLVAYPEIATPPRSLAGSAAQAVVADVSMRDRRSVEQLADFIRRENVRVVYFTDFYARHWGYRLLRRAGAQRIIVHDHTSGMRTPRRGLMRWAKWAYMRVPGALADVVVTVSDYVARRAVEVTQLPPERVVRVWNGLPIPEAAGAIGSVRAALGIEARQPMIVCACRAAAEKGVAHLLRAFDRIAALPELSVRAPVLVYVGDGPEMTRLRELRESLPSRDRILLTGYRTDARDIVQAADLCVVPSVWQDAFPLAVLESMARGKPIVATEVGGVPEMIEHDRTGLLVPPADEAALAEAMLALLRDPERARRLGQAARERARERFTPDQQIRRLTGLVEQGLGATCRAVAA